MSTDLWLKEQQDEAILYAQIVKIETEVDLQNKEKSVPVNTVVWNKQCMINTWINCVCR